MTKAISASMRGWMKRPAGIVRAVVESHVVEQHAAVGNIDVQRVLHRLRGQADLPADYRAAGFQLAADKRRLHRIGVGHFHVRMADGQQPDLPAGRVGLEQILGRPLDFVFRKRHVSSATPFFSTPMPSASISTSSPGLRKIGGSKRAPAPVGVPVTMMSPGTRVVKVEI